MAYTPDPFDDTQPTEDKSVSSAAAEFRASKAELKRGLRYPSGESAAFQGDLPAAASRAGRFLAFDSVTGKPAAGPLLASWTITQAQIANIDTVATNVAAVQSVATDIADVTAVADNIGAVNTAAANVAAITAVAADAADIGVVASISADVSATAAIGADVTTVATNVAAVTNVSTNMAAVVAATANAAAAAASAAAASDSEDAAAASALAASGSATTASGHATTASTQAGIATTQAGIATTQAGIATTQANNAAASAASAYNSANSASASATAAEGYLAPVTATSSTSLTVAIGNQSLTVETGKPFAPGMPVKIARTSAPTTSYMTGTVVSYDTLTGALVVSVDAVQGSGTFSAWTISLQASAAGTGAFWSEDPTEIRIVATLATINTYTTSHSNFRALELSATKAFLDFTNGDCAVVDTSTDTLGPVTAYTATPIGAPGVGSMAAVVDASTVLTVATPTASVLEARLIAISGVNCTPGTAVTLTTSNSVLSISQIVRIGDAFIVSYTLTGNVRQLVAVTVVGGVVTIGTPVTLSGVGSAVAATLAVSGSYVVAVYNSTSASSNCGVATFSVSGATLTPVGTTSSSAITSALFVVPTPAGNFIILLAAQYLGVLTLSAGVPTVTTVAGTSLPTSLYAVKTYAGGQQLLVSAGTGVLVHDVAGTVNILAQANNAGSNSALAAVVVDNKVTWMFTEWVREVTLNSLTSPTAISADAQFTFAGGQLLGGSRIAGSLNQWGTLSGSIAQNGKLLAWPSSERDGVGVMWDGTSLTTYYITYPFNVSTNTVYAAGYWLLRPRLTGKTNTIQFVARKFK